MGRACIQQGSNVNCELLNVNYQMDFNYIGPILLYRRPSILIVTMIFSMSIIYETTIKITEGPFVKVVTGFAPLTSFSYAGSHYKLDFSRQVNMRMKKRRTFWDKAIE